MLQFDKLAWCCAHCSRLEHRWWDEFAAECVGSWSRIFEFDFHLTFRRDLFFFHRSSSVLLFCANEFFFFFGCVCLRTKWQSGKCKIQNRKNKNKEKSHSDNTWLLAHHRICNLHLIWIWIGPLVVRFFFFSCHFLFSSVYVHFISFQRNFRLRVVSTLTESPGRTGWIVT